MYKLIAIDLDGTLLNSYGEISKKDKNAIEKALNSGAKVVLTSGRMNSAIINLAKSIKADEYMISGNGAVIYDLQKNKTIYNNCLTKQKVLEIVKICEENSMYYNIYTEKCVITKSLNYNALYYHSENQKKPPEKWTNIIIVENMEEYIENLKDKNFLKMTVCDSDSSIFQRILNTIKKDDSIEVLEVSHMSRKIVRSQGEEIPLEYYYTEISNKNVNKWSALQFLIKKLKIKPQEVLAIGDNTNDEQMIKNAGLGVAMGNSNPILKEMANEVTDTNDNNGVAKVIEKYF